MSKQDVMNAIELVSAGMGEVNERREMEALDEWLPEGDYTAEDVHSLQSDWTEFAEENEVYY